MLAGIPLRDLRIDPAHSPRWLRAILVLALIACTVSIYAPGDWRNGDVSLYHSYAQGFWGALRHPILPVEYPPLSVLPFGLTLLGPAQLSADVFAGAMGLVFVAGFLAFRRWVSPRAAWTYAIYLLAAGPATVLFRFDLLPALLLGAALWLLKHRRFSGAYAIVAVGVLLKVFPLILMPVAAIAEWRDGEGPKRQRIVAVALHAAGALALVGIGFVAAYVVDPSHGLGALTYSFQRPVEVESVPATVMWLGSFLGAPVHGTASYGSYDLVSQLSSGAAVIAGVLLVCGLAWVYWCQFRGRLSAERAAIAALLVLMCTSKVLSAQYFIWLAVVLAVTIEFEMRWLGVFLATALVFPTLLNVGVHTAGNSVAYDQVAFVGIALRNAVLLGCTGAFLWRRGDHGRRECALHMARELGLLKGMQGVKRALWSETAAIHRPPEAGTATSPGSEAGTRVSALASARRDAR